MDRESRRQGGGPTGRRMRSETEQLVLFETYLCQVGSIGPHVAEIRQFVRMLPEAQGAIAAGIDRNAQAIQKQARAAIATHSEFADTIGYKHLRKREHGSRDTANARASRAGG